MLTGFRRRSSSWLAQRTPALVTCVGLGVGLASMVAQAGPKDFAIFATRMGGDSESAQPYVSRMAEKLAEATGWKKGELSGRFFSSKKEITAFVETQKPGFGLVEPWLYLELKHAQGLELVAEVESADLNSPKLHVVVTDAAVKGLADLKGKSLWTHLADSPRYLSLVVLEQETPIEGQVQLKQVSNVMKSARAVLRGEATATLLDDDQLAAARKLQGGETLRVVYSSKAQPPVAVVVFGKTLPPAEKKNLTKALMGLCAVPSNADLCKELRIAKMKAPTTALWAAADARFAKAGGGTK